MSIIMGMAEELGGTLSGGGGGGGVGPRGPPIAAPLGRKVIRAIRAIRVIPEALLRRRPRPRRRPPRRRPTPNRLLLVE